MLVINTLNYKKTAKYYNIFQKWTKKFLHFYIFFDIIAYRKQGGIIVAKVGNRQNKTFVCTVCGKEGYRMSKNVKNTTERMELSKYCSNCRKHTTHKEKK